MDKDTRFVRATATVAAVMAALLIVIGCRVWYILPQLYEDQVRSFAAEGKLEAAEEKYEELQRVLAERLDIDTKNRCAYEIACAMLSFGHYEDAQYLFSSLGEFKDSPQKIKECIYGPAHLLYMQGKYHEAAEIFRSLGVFSDSAYRYKDCLIGIAEELYQTEQYSDAINMLRDVGEYGGALERAYEIALEITGDPGFAEEMVNGSVSPEEQEKLLALEFARQKLNMEKISAGRNHSLAVRSDGTVLAVGSNKYGQCDVGEWTDIIAVCAGADFSLGLRKDGTVLATGSNKHGQCDVSEWSNVRSIAANDYDSFAVTNQGKLLFSGYHDYSDSLAADNIRDVYAGAYQGACILSDGSIITSNLSSRSSLKPASVVLSTALSVSLMWDGTISSEFDRIPQWDNIVALTMNARGLVGLTSEGQVESFFLRESDTVDFDLDGKYIVAASAGGGHYLFLSSDGKVYAFGDNSSGQCNTEDWQI